MEDINITGMAASLNLELPTQEYRDKDDLLNNSEIDTAFQNPNGDTSLVNSGGMVIKTESCVDEHEPIKLHVKLQSSTLAHVIHKKKKRKSCKHCNMSFFSKSLFELHLKHHAQQDKALVKVVRLPDTKDLEKSSNTYAMTDPLLESDQLGGSSFNPDHHHLKNSTTNFNNLSNGEHRTLTASPETLSGTLTELSVHVLPKLNFSPTHPSQLDKISGTPEHFPSSVTSFPVTKIADSHKALECPSPLTTGHSVSVKTECTSGKPCQDAPSTSSESITKNLFTELNRHLTEVAKSIMKNMKTSATEHDSFLGAFGDNNSQAKNINTMKSTTNINSTQKCVLESVPSSGGGPPPLPPPPPADSQVVANPSSNQGINSSSVTTLPVPILSDIQSSSTNLGGTAEKVQISITPVKSNLLHSTNINTPTARDPLQIEPLHHSQQKVDIQKQNQKVMQNPSQNVPRPAGTVQTSITPSSVKSSSLHPTSIPTARDPSQIEPLHSSQHKVDSQEPVRNSNQTVTRPPSSQTSNININSSRATSLSAPTLSDTQNSSTNNAEPVITIQPSNTSSTLNSGLLLPANKSVLAARDPSQAESLHQSHQKLDDQNLVHNSNPDKSERVTLASSQSHTATVHSSTSSLQNTCRFQPPPSSSGVNDSNHHTKNTNDNIAVSESSIQSSLYSQSAPALSNLNVTSINNSVFGVNQYNSPSDSRPASVMILDPPPQTERDPALPSIQSVVSLAPGNASRVCGDVTVTRSTLNVPHIYENPSSRCPCATCLEIVNGDLFSKSEVMVMNGRYQYACPGCRKCFVHRTLLIRHCRAAKHAYICNTCSSGFLEKVGLDRHHRYFHQMPGHRKSHAVVQNRVTVTAHVQSHNVNKNPNLYPAPLMPSNVPQPAPYMSQVRTSSFPASTTTRTPTNQNLNKRQRLEPADDEVVIIGVGCSSNGQRPAPSIVVQTPIARPAIAMKNKPLQQRPPGATQPPTKRVRFSHPMATSNEDRNTRNYVQQPNLQNASPLQLVHILNNADITLTPIRGSPTQGKSQVSNKPNPKPQCGHPGNFVNPNNVTSIRSQAKPVGNEMFRRPSQERQLVRPAPPSIAVTRTNTSVVPQQRPPAVSLGRTSATSTITSPQIPLPGHAGQGRNTYRVHPVMTPLNTDSAAPVVKLNIQDSRNQALPKWHHPVPTSVSIISNSQVGSTPRANVRMESIPVTTNPPGSVNTHLRTNHQPYGPRVPITVQNNGSRWLQSGPTRMQPPQNVLRHPSMSHVTQQFAGPNSSQIRHSSPNQLIRCSTVSWGGGNHQVPIRPGSQVTPRSISTGRLPMAGNGIGGPNITVIKCKVCAVTFPTRVAYQEHVQVMHTPQYSSQRQHFANNNVNNSQMPGYNVSSTSQKALCSEITANYSRLHSLGSSTAGGPISSVPAPIAGTNRTISVRAPGNPSCLPPTSQFNYSGIEITNRFPPPNYADALKMTGSSNVQPTSVTNAVNVQPSSTTANTTSSVRLPAMMNAGPTKPVEIQAPTLSASANVDPDLVIIQEATKESLSNTGSQPQDTVVQQAPIRTNVADQTINSTSGELRMDAVVSTVTCVTATTAPTMVETISASQPQSESVNVTSIEPPSIFCTGNATDLFSEAGEVGGISDPKDWNVADLESFILDNAVEFVNDCTSLPTASSEGSQNLLEQNNSNGDVPGVDDGSVVAKEGEKQLESELQADDGKTVRKLLSADPVEMSRDISGDLPEKDNDGEVAEKAEVREMTVDDNCAVDVLAEGPGVLQEEEEVVKNTDGVVATGDIHIEESLKCSSPTYPGEENKICDTGSVDSPVIIMPQECDNRDIPEAAVVTPTEKLEGSVSYLRSPNKDWIRRIKIAKARRFRRMPRTCPICDQSFNTRLEMLKHLRSHQKFFVHKCRYCGTSFKTRKKLANHICSSHESAMVVPKLRRRRKNKKGDGNALFEQGLDPSKLVVAIFDRDKVEANMDFWQRMGVVGLMTLDSLHTYLNQNQKNGVTKATEKSPDDIANDVLQC